MEAILSSMFRPLVALTTAITFIKVRSLAQPWFLQMEDMHIFQDRHSREAKHFLDIMDTLDILDMSAASAEMNCWNPARFVHWSPRQYNGQHCWNQNFCFAAQRRQVSLLLLCRRADLELWF